MACTARQVHIRKTLDSFRKFTAYPTQLGLSDFAAAGRCEQEL